MNKTKRRFEMEDEKMMQYREEVKDKILEYWDYADTITKYIAKPEVAYPCLEKAEAYCAEFFDMQPWQFDKVALSLAPEVKGLQEKVLRHRAAVIANKIETSPELNIIPYTYQIDKPAPMFDLICKQQLWEDINGNLHGKTDLYDLYFATQHPTLVLQSFKQGLENLENFKDSIAKPEEFDDYEGWKNRKRYEVFESTSEYDKALEEAMLKYDVPSITVSNDNEVMGIDTKLRPVLNAVCLRLLESNTEFVADTRERNIKSSVKEAFVKPEEGKEGADGDKARRLNKEVHGGRDDY
jgi:hypothetical protein